MRLVIIFSLLFSIQNLYAQISIEQDNKSSADSIYILKKGLGFKYYHKGNQLNLKGISDLVKSNPEAKKNMRISKGLLAPAYLLSFSGGFMIGYGIGSAISGGKANMAVVGPGIGAWAAGIAMGIVSDKKRASAIKKYNAGLKKL